MRFHIISMHLRRVPGDRAYLMRECFDAESVIDACQKHVAYKCPGVRAHVLRDGATGHRYSVADSIDVCAEMPA